MKTIIPAIILLFMICSTVNGQQMVFSTEEFSITVSSTGHLTAISDPLTGINYLPEGQSAPVLQIRSGDNWEGPARIAFNDSSGTLRVEFPSKSISAGIKICRGKSYLAFELSDIQPEGTVNAICWGPFPTIIGKTIGEVIGVVNDGEYAIGIQALNVKTLGGELKNAEGSEDTRGSAAVKQPYGSSLQAYSLDRSRPRILDVWCESFPHFPRMPVEPIPNETPVGSKIGLFGCPVNKVLQHISEIELAENLPHPMINGTWVKESAETGRAYLISDFTENNIDTMLAYTRRAGLISLYHEGPFQSWGHYILDPVSFPQRNASMKRCVEKADKLGLRIGVHTLTTFINTNDPYVTPVPDKRLALTGSSSLRGDIEAMTKDIPVGTNEYFNNTKANTLHAVKIGDEIIRYRDVTSVPPFILTDCQRGAFGTVPSSHLKGEPVGMLMDYPYEVFFPNFDLQQEIAGNLARFFNETGVSQLDFDGHEGCYSSGQGDFGMQAFADKVYRETSHTLVNGTSRSSHYYWHICHYWNWGEPWYGGFRESQGDYRLDNQPLLERNYMPNMLGWFLLSSTTLPEDIEWMMARAAGYNAGFALVARSKSLRENPSTGQLLDLIRIWQEASRNRIFSEDQIERLKDPKYDFHLEKDAKGWRLYPFTKYTFQHNKKELQPGQTGFSEWVFENKDDSQSFLFTLTIMGKQGSITDIWMELDGYNKIEIPGEFKAGNSVVCNGSKLTLYNEKGAFEKDIVISKEIPLLTAGIHKIKFGCTFSADKDLASRFVIKTISRPEMIIK
jgi:hypothetical protein